MKIMRYVAWGIAIFTVFFFSFKMCRNEANNHTFNFFPEATQFFAKIFFQYDRLDLLRPLNKNSQNVDLRRILTAEM